MKKTFCCIILLIATILPLSGCEEAKEKTISYRKDAELYSKAVKEILPEYTLYDCKKNEFLYELQNNNSVVAFDAQAIPCIKNNTAKYWYPQVLATTVIAVDRDKVHKEITSWKDLVDLEEDVSILYDRFNLASIAYGLEGENYTTKSATNLLKKIASQNHLFIDDFHSPIIICYDYQVVDLNKNGRNFDIIIPKEGTFTYELGVLSNVPIEFGTNSNLTLLSHGFRLVDTSSLDENYPSNNAYEPAKRVKDYNHLAKVTARYYKELRHDILKIRMYSSADQIQHQLFATLFIIIIIIWCTISLKRVLKKGTRNIIIFTCGLIIGWISVRFLKYQLPTNGELNRYLWYSYYIFQLFLPASLLWLSWSLDSQSNKHILAKIIVCLSQLSLLMLVMTNDLHQLVFKFGPLWFEGYKYGIFYYVILSSCIVLTTWAVVNMLKSAKNSPKPHALTFPISFVSILFIYGIGYCMNIPFAKESDFAMTVCLLALLFFESAMRTELIPINSNYLKLFYLSPMNMQIIGKNSQVILCANGAQPIDKSLLEKLQNCEDAPVRRDEDTLLYMDKIVGGMVVWQEDIRNINQMQNKININISRLKIANELLEEKYDNHLIETRLNQKMLLLSMVESQISNKINYLNEMINNINNEKDAVAKITMLLCNIKRRCSLLFREMDNYEMTVEDLSDYLDELSEFAQYLGTSIAGFCNIEEMISVYNATLIYEFFFITLVQCIKSECHHVLEQLLPYNNGVLLKILPSSFIDTSTLFEKGLKEKIDQAKGKIIIKQLDDTLGVSLYMPKGDVNNDSFL